MNARKYQYCLLFSVTLTGMAVLVIEITATRILAPFFGNSIFTFSSVISTILAALSLGYYIGGRLSDHKPSDLLFYCLIVIAGFAVLLLQLLSATLLPGLAYRLSMINGPLIVSVMLFLLPAFFLGMLSPFAIKLLHINQAQKGIGNAAGLVFFWSTLGSIAGSLSAGFILIPRWGVSHIVIGVGLGLVLLGGVGILVFSRRYKTVSVFTILLGLIFSTVLMRIITPVGNDVVYNAHGVYEKILVRDVPYQGRTARILIQDRNTNSGMFLDDGRMAFEYTKYYDLYRLFTAKLKHVLIIGGGAYSVPKAILRDYDDTIIDVAEIEPSLHRLAKQYFALADDLRLRNHVIDGRRFLHDTALRYDLIFSDAYHSFASVPMQFTTQEFFRLASSKLEDDGVFIANYFGSLAPDTRAMIYSVLRTMRTVFPQVYLLATVNPQSDEPQNFIFIGHNSTNPHHRIELQQATVFKFAYPILNKIAGLELLPSDEFLAPFNLLTDNFAPVEYYAANLIRQLEASSGPVHRD